MATSGEVRVVTEHLAGSELSATATNAGTLHVYDLEEFDLDGGQITIQGGGTLTYTVPDTEGDELVLGSTLAGTFTVGTPVYLYPETKERFARIMEPGGVEELEVRVPHTAFSMLPVGSRVVGDGSAEVVYAEYDESSDLVVTDVLGKDPVYTGAAFQTSEDDPRVRMDETGLFVTNSTGEQEVALDDDGLRMLAVENLLAIGARTVRWIDPDDATTAATIYASQVSSEREVLLQSSAKSGHRTEAVIEAVGPGGGATQRANITPAAFSDNSSAVVVNAGVFGYTLLDSNGGSEFAFDTGWTAYSPTWTNLTVGNGTQTARYCQIGNVVFFKILLTWGSTTSISGNVSVSIPVAAANSIQTLGLGVGIGRYRDASAGTVYNGLIPLSSTTTVDLNYNTVSGANVVGTVINATAPATWTTNDNFVLQGHYEVA